MNKRYYLGIILLAISFLAKAALTSNVIITDYQNDYIIEVEKDGVTPKLIKNKQTVSYIATRTPATAILHTYYNDFITVDKAKAKGNKPIYAKANRAGIFYDDSQICYLPVSLNEILKEYTASIELTRKKPELSDLIYLFDVYPINSYKFTLRMPVALKDRYDIAIANRPNECDIERTVSPDGKEYIISVTAHNLPEIYNEDYAPAVRHIAPYISIMGQFQNVDELYKSFDSYVQKVDPGKEAVAEFAAEITKGCTDDLSKIEAVTHWVHDNIRYIAIENGDLGHAPDLASQVLEKRYGDCKGSASLIAGILQSLGIDSRLVWIGTSNIPEDWSERPLYSTGNHMIAAAVLPDTILYLDGTTGPMDFGLYPIAIQGKQTLIQDGENCILGRVPILPPATNTDSVVTVLRLNGNNLVGIMTDYVRGHYKSAMINIVRSADSKDKEKALISKLSLGRKNVRLSSPASDGLKPDGGVGSIRADITIPNVLTTAGDRSYLSLAQTFPNLSSLLIDTKDRHYSATLQMKRHIVAKVSIELPAEYSVDSLPDDLTVENEWFTSNYSVFKGSDSMLECYLMFELHNTEIGYDKIADYNSALKSLIKTISQNITLIKN